MKFFAAAILCVLSAFGQTATAPVTAPTTPATPAILPLPTTFVGTGIAWDRGQPSQLSGLGIYAKNLTDANKNPTNYFIWTAANTPISPSPAGSGPVPTTLSGGAAFVTAAVPSGRVLLVFVLMGGLSATQASAGLQFNGNVGVAIRVSSDLYVMPGVGGSMLASGASSGSFIACPAVGLLYGFGLPKNATTAKAPTHKQMAAVMRKLNLPLGDLK